MVIRPTTVFKLIAGVPFDNTHKHTILFKTKSEQLTYFNTKMVRTFTDFSYVRQNGYVVRVPIKADAIYNCNYCMFQNTGFGDKWFYGFVTDIEYVNNEVSAVSFEIDYLQTWLTDFVFDESYVEREHVASDEVGEHTVLEPIDFGDNFVQDTHNHYFGVPSEIEAQDDSWKVIIQYVPNTIQDVSDGGIVIERIGDSSGIVHKGIYSGANIAECSVNADEINGNVNYLLSHGYTITNMYMIPNSFTKYFPVEIGDGEVGSRPTEYTQSVGLQTREYTPKNNKLFTFPYTFMRVLNNQGGIADYKWENWAGGSYRFSIRSNFINRGVCNLSPYNYERVGNRESELSINNFPVLSWNENAFLSFIGSQGISTAIDTIANVGTGRVAENYDTLHSFEKDPEFDDYRYGTGLQGGIIKTGASIVGKAFLPKTFKGNGSDTYLDVAENRFGYTFLTMGIKPEMAKVVDDFLTRFGYQVNCIKEPELTSRRAFNYLKTKECNIIGNVPSEAKTNICGIFNSGITLWHTTNVGDYSQDNSIVNE